ncbi:MAG: hypothetical protein JST04_07925 [Bdellovibrionales bacterium]|nr:hypothetical protein [Bdellovibrionales bacterium]
MTRLMDSIAENLRKAFPRMPMSLFDHQKEVLSLAYLRKAQKYFDFAAMYPVEPGLATGEILHGGFRRVHSPEGNPDLTENNALN